jgi:putative SOS response-associated peptidase YedK
MCGRIALYSDAPRLARLLEAGIDPDLIDDLEPSWNVGPTSSILGVRESPDGERILGAYRWGLVPAGAKDPAAVKGTFNARAETVATKPMFRSAFRRGRALIPVDGFFEWRTIEKVKRPYYFRRADDEPIVFAGLTEYWRGPDGSPLRSATIITTEAGPDMEGIHDRMPVVLEPGAWDRWLDPEVVDRDELEAMLHPALTGTLVHYPVGKEVGNTNNDGPGLLREVADVADGWPGDQLDLRVPGTDHQR